ncbi:MAG: hypothetical protein Q7K54_04520 [Candidatus Parcubacteria bacterium]|nr:hypothetical protein [Candidatus Parcubacteria bacterium]
MGDFKYKIAEKKHDRALRKLLHDNPIVGSISIAFENEPSYFLSSLVGNEFSETIICEDEENQKVVALLTKSIKNAYINGIENKVGYLNNLRVDKKYRGRKVVSNAWNLFHEVHQRGGVPYYLTSIIKDNHNAKRALLSKKTGKPQFIKIGDYTTFVINLYKKKRELVGGLEVARASADDLDEIIDCLNRNGRKKQFYPCYKKEDFINSQKLRDFRIQDFFIAKKKNRIVGVVGAWNQIGFKQVVVKEYRNGMKIFKPFYNFCAKIFSFSPLPEINHSFNCLYLSFIAVDDNDKDIFRAIIRRIYNRFLGKQYSYLTLGLANNDFLSDVAREFFSIKYESEIYLVTYKEREDELKNLIPYIELATL